MIRRLLRALARRSPIQPFVNGNARFKAVWGGYYGEGHGEGAFVALEIRLPKRVAIGVRIPGARPMRLVVRVLQAAHMAENRPSPLADERPSWERYPVGQHAPGVFDEFERRIAVDA